MKPLTCFNRFVLFVLCTAGIGALCAVTGCRSLPRSGFDPNGERLFENCPLSSKNLGNCELLGRRKVSPTMVTATPQTPADTIQSAPAQVFTPQPATGLPGNIGAVRSNPNVPQYTNTATAVPPGTHAVTTAMVIAPDATIKQPFNGTGGYALPVVPVQGPALIMTPREQIAPIGSEVVLITSYLGNQDRLVTNEKIEWTLEGTGTIEQFDPGSACDPMFGDYVRAKKQTDRYAITKTSQVYRTLDRGTANTSDDIHLLRGQTWITVNSLREGTSHVTAFAPSLADWSKRTDVGVIHWVDAQWIIPRLSMAPVGESRALTTTVLRATNGQARKGWIVRYEILNGPPAGFGATNAQIEELETDISGQVTAVLTPATQTSGTNTIRISIIRPAGPEGSGDRITVGSEIVRQTWSGRPSVTVNIQGPPTARVGDELPYRITVNNQTSQFVQGIVLLPIPPVASYIRSNPVGQLTGSTVLWNVNVPPQGALNIDAAIRQGTVGSLWLRPEFRQTSASVSQAPVMATPQPPAVSWQPPVQSPPVTTSPETAAERYQPKPPASTPSISASQLTLRIEVNPEFKVEKGQPLDFYFYVNNNGSSEIRNARLEVPLPNRFRNQTIQAASDPPDAVHLDVAKHTAWMDKITIPAKGAVFLRLQYPTIDANGYEITGEVFVNGQSAGKVTEPITP